MNISKLAKTPQINLLHLYPKSMNIYGDYGNVLTIKKRCEAYGVNVKVLQYNLGDSFPDVKSIDLIIGGGGQDQGQLAIADDLFKIKPALSDLAHNLTPALLICGLYQLYGHYFQTSSNQKLDGIGIFDCWTIAKKKRIIGNIISQSDMFGEVIGYENHSGQTFLGVNASPLALTSKKCGNNLVDNTEGIFYKNCIGSYLHGSLLPKNPAISDFLIQCAVSNKGFGLDLLKSKNKHVLYLDYLAEKARKVAKTCGR